MRTTVLRVVVAGLALALLATACSREEPYVVRAVFDDVIDLTTKAAVKIADVPVGTVEAIELTDDHQAMVTMHITRDVALPSRVTASLRKTSVLGERFVELVPDRDSGGRLESGTLITDTQVLPDIEELVGSSSELLAAVTADRLAGALAAGATGVGGRGETLGGLVDDLSVVVAAYEENSDDLVRLIDGLEAFLADVGPEAELHGRAFEELARAAAVLEAEDTRLLDTLADVASLARTGTDIITTHRGRMDDFFTRFDRITGELVRQDEHIERLFFELSKHNFNTIRGVNAEHAQVFLDFLVCGENDRPGHPVRACDDPPQGQPRPDVRERQH